MNRTGQYPTDCDCTSCEEYKAIYKQLSLLSNQNEEFRRIGRPLDKAIGQVYDAWVAYQNHWTHHMELDEDEEDSEKKSDWSDGYSSSEPLDDGESDDYGSTEDGQERSETCGCDYRNEGAIYTNTSISGEADDKFMVCDHCMSHALPCNEASVCNQCQLYEQPCIHRRCRLSPDSKEICSNGACRYVHEDAIKQDEDKPDWIVLGGKLPRYLCRGPLTAKTFSYESVKRGCDLEWNEQVRLRQEEGLEALKAGVDAGAGALQNLTIKCDCKPPSSVEDVTPSLASFDHDIAPAITTGSGSCKTCGDVSATYGIYAACGHKTCLRCAIIRMQLKGTAACPTCLKTSNLVWQCLDSETTIKSCYARAGDYKPMETKTGILMLYNQVNWISAVRKLLGFYCPAGCEGNHCDWRGLAAHAFYVHGKYFCKRCQQDETGCFPCQYDILSAEDFEAHQEEMHGGYRGYVRYDVGPDWK